MKAWSHNVMFSGRSPCLASASARCSCQVRGYLRPEVLLIPGTSSIGHLEENMAGAGIELDSEARGLLG